MMSRFDWSVVDYLNCFTLSILLHAASMSPHFTLSFRSFCLLKVAHLFKIASLCALLGPLCDLGSALSVLSLSFLHSFFLSSLRVRLGILSSSLLEISPSFDLLFPVSPPFPSPSFLDTLTSCSLSLTSFESAWTYCSARSLQLYLYLPILLLFLPLSHPPSSPSSQSLSLPFFPLLPCLRSPACGILLSSLPLTG